MNALTLISPEELGSRLGSEGLLVVDCRFDLADPARAAAAYAAGHIPGAAYANLDTDLSDLNLRGLGRHPLPEAGAFATFLGRIGFTRQLQVVAYDDAAGALAAARLWWLLRLIGHARVAVLDGGFGTWTKAGLPLDGVRVERAGTRVEAAYDASQLVAADALRSLDTDMLLLDARAAPRFRGEVEPIDPVAGHIPGARNRPFSDNLDGGRFKPADVLRGEFSALLGATPPERVVHMCGSGVTACHNLLAMEHAGLSGSRLYAPSWSGWISDPARPVATGA